MRCSSGRALAGTAVGMGSCIQTPLTPFTFTTAGVTLDLHRETESTRNPGTTYGTAENKGTKRGNVQPHRITQTTMPGEGEKFHKLTTRNAIKPALFHSKLSESIYTKDTNRNISDKRFQAPFYEADLTPSCM